MTLLSAISVVCFFVMLYVAIAVAQTIRSRRLAALHSASTPPPAPQEFFEAGDYRQPGSLRLIQQIEQQVAPRANTAPSISAVQQPGRSTSTTPATSSSQPSAIRRAIVRPGDPGFVERRQSRQPAPNGIERRADRAHYNKDMGDLSDPYTQSARPLGESGRRSDHTRIMASMSRIAPRDQQEN